MQQITVKGLASQKVIFETAVSEDETDMSIMDFLHQHGVPIASSCRGEGVCKKCIVNEDVLSCQLSLKNLYLRCSKDKIEINVSYL